MVKKGKLKITNEFLQYALFKNPHTEIYNMTYDPDRGIISLFITGEDLPEKEEGDVIADLRPNDYVKTFMK